MDPSEFMSAFLEELDEQLVQLEQKILALEEQGNDDETVSDLFRVAHTLKGSCAAMGFEAMKDLTHAMEQILDEVRHHRLAVSTEMVQILFQCFDGLQSFRENIGDDGEASLDVKPLIEELHAFLEQDTEQASPATAEQDTREAATAAAVEGTGQNTGEERIATEEVAATSEEARTAIEEAALVSTEQATAVSPAGQHGAVTLTQEAHSRVSESVSRGIHVYDVYLEFHLESIMRGVRAYLAVEVLEGMGDVLQVSPSIEDMEVMEDSKVPSYHIVLATPSESEPIRLAVSTSEYARVIVSPLESPDLSQRSGIQDVTGPSGPSGSPAPAGMSNPSGPSDPSGPSGMARPSGSRDSSGARDPSDSMSPQGLPTESNLSGPTEMMGLPETADRKQVPVATGAREAKPVRKASSVRVDVEQLETLMNLVGELVIDQARMDQMNRNLSKKYKGEEDVNTLGDISRHVSRVVGQLQENIMMARMLPIESLFDRFPRIVRDLAKSLDKDIRLVIEGKETRLDRTVIEEIADPLIHLVRNAVDHGIESGEKRLQANKSAEGTVRLSASHQDNKVLITVQDDGAGMTPGGIRQAAIRKGVISEQEAEMLNEAECLQLIFRPGFSTAQKVSDVSGRGVGMDIVRDHIERLNGTIDIETREGKGTTFKIQLPLTLAILPGLLVGVDDSTFIVPISNVFEIVRIEPEAIQSVHGRPTILLRDQPTCLVYLRDYFGLPKKPTTKKYIQVVVVGVAQKRMAMVVDDLYGNQEIVKKALNDRVGTPDGIAGATILGNGQVGLILDIAAIQRGPH